MRSCLRMNRGLSGRILDGHTKCPGFLPLLALQKKGGGKGLGQQGGSLLVKVVQLQV